MPYTTWTVVEKDAPGPDGTVAVRIELTGAGEPTKRLGYVIDGNTTINAMRTFIWSQANRTASRSIADAITVGQTGNTTKPADPVPPAPTAEDVWRNKAARYITARDLALTNVTAVSDRTALFADLNATYVTSYT